MTRTDIHRPSAPEFDPAAYTLVDVYDLSATAANGYGESESRALSEAHDQLKADGFTAGSHTYGCGHCGQTNLRYVALLVREDVKEWIYAGQDCLSARFTGQTKASFDKLRKDAELARAKQAKKTAWLALCEENPALTWASYAVNIEKGVQASFADLAGQKVVGRDRQYLGTGAEDHFLSAGLGWGFGTMIDIARKARTYGDASEKQIALIERILGEIDGKVEAYRGKIAVRAAAPQAGPVPTGRVVIEGEIVGIKEVDDNFSYHGGTITKMTVKLDNGARVYGTMPAAINGFRGDRVRFTATVEASNDDASFGFAKRPAKAEVLVAANELVAA